MSDIERERVATEIRAQTGKPVDPDKVDGVLERAQKQLTQRAESALEAAYSELGVDR